MVKYPITMAFKVSYRGKSGGQESIIIEAESRSQLFAELQKRGISAIRVEETSGKAKKSKPAPAVPSARKPSPFRGVLAGLLVIALAVAAWFYLLPTLEQVKAKKDKKPSLIAEVAPEIAEPTPVEEEPTPEPVTPEPPPFVKRPGALQLPNGQVITFRPPPPGQEKTVWVHGRKYIADSEGNFYDASPVPTFDNRFENAMESMSVVGKGILPAAALSISKDDIAKYLASPIVINDDDPEDVVEKKIATAEMKELLREYITDGGTWEDFVMEVSNIKRNERMLQGQAISEIAKMLREGDEDGAQLYHAKVDEFMKSMGYRGLKVPESWGLGELPAETEIIE